MPNSPLHELQLEQGGVFSDSDQPPIQFGDSTTEARAARDSTALFDLSDWSQIKISGADRQSFLHNFCTNDINALSPGAGCEAFLTSIKGRVLGHFFVSAGEDDLRITSVPGTATGIIEHLDRYLITEDVELRDITRQVATLCLVGPQAAAVLNEQLGVDASEMAMYARVCAESASADLTRVPLTSQPTFLLCVPLKSAADLWQRLISADVQPAGSDVWNALRIAAGYPVYGVDISEDNIAQEVGRTIQAISFSKGCYLGQEPIARLDAMGHVNRLLCSVRLATTEATPSGTALFDVTGEQQIGTLSSSAVDQFAEDLVALGILKAGFAGPGAEVSIRAAEGALVTGTVSHGSND